MPRFKHGTVRPSENETIEQDKRTVEVESPLPGVSGASVDTSTVSGAGAGVFLGRRHSPENVIDEVPRTMRKA